MNNTIYKKLESRIRTILPDLDWGARQIDIGEKYFFITEIHIEDILRAYKNFNNPKFESSKINADSDGFIIWKYREFGDDLEYEETVDYDFKKALHEQSDEVHKFLRKIF